MFYFDAVADVKPTNQSMQGSSVIFTQVGDIAAQTTALNESTDVTPVTMTDSTATVTLVEQGAVITTTAKLRGTSYIPVDPVVANLIGYNAGLSVDTIAANVLVGGTNVRYATGGTTAPTARNTVEPEDTLVANNVRRALADLRGANVAPFGSYYAAFIHPDVSYDLRGQTGAAAWRDPHTYSQPDEIWTGEVGAFEGFRFMETNTAPVFADAGSSTTLTDVYATLFLGRQAMAKAYSTTVSAATPQVVQGPVIDALARFVPMGWYWLGGLPSWQGHLKSALINGERCDANPQQAGRKAGQLQRLSERTRRHQRREATVRTCGNRNRKSHAEMTWPRIQRVTNDARFREAAIRRVESSSSIGTNA